MVKLIDSISTSSSHVYPGEPVVVTVTLSEESAVAASVAIAGIRGISHVLQAPVAPGDWAIPVTAGLPDGELDRQTVIVVVQDAPPVIPRLAVRRDPFKAYSVVFSFPTETFPDGTRFEWLVGPIAAATTDPVLIADLSVLVDDSRPFVIVPIEVGVRLPDGTILRPRRTLTLWSLYQVIREAGQVCPPVTTDGIAARRLGEDSGLFRAKFTFRNLEPVDLIFTSMQLQWHIPSGDAISVPGPPTVIDVRVVPGASHTQTVDLDRSTAPEDSDACTVHLSGEAGSLSAYVEVAFDLRTLAPLRLPDIPQYRKPWPWEIERWADDVLRKINPFLVTEDHGVSTHGLWVLDQLAAAAVRARAVVEVPERQVGRQIRRLSQRLELEEVRQRWLPITETERPVQLNPMHVEATRIDVPVRTLEQFGIKAGALLDDQVKRLEEPQFDREIVLGSPCDPDNLPADIPAGMACQFSGTWEEKVLPDRVMNAEKGDIFLSPGGSGVIGGLLRKVTPAQKYAHTGICTKNRVEVAHATAAEEWLKEQHSGGLWEPPFGEAPAPSDGFTPAALKYVWPGGIIQTVGEAMTGSVFQSPDGKFYTLTCLGQSGFAQFGENWEVIPALMVKPHPLQDSPAVRTRLHQVADAARALCVTGDDTRVGKHSKLHYRFFGYTDAALSDPAPDGNGWATGTLPAVCSSFIWLAAKRAGVAHFEGGILEPEDLRPNDRVELRPDIPDGLYHYTSAERADAAEWLYNYYQNDIVTTLDKETGGTAIGAVWDLFSDIADDVSNQILNTFAHDWTDTDAKDSERWRDEPRDGTAVSPDDLMHWDGPDKGGLWGTFSAMDYRSSRPERVPTFVWRQTTGPGTLAGHVTFHGAPAPGADVKVGGQHRNTDASGNFTVELFEGPYVVEAGMHVEAVGYVEAKSPVTVLFNQTVKHTTDLREPPDVFRRLVVTAEGMVRDDESFADDEVEAVGFRREFDTQPFMSHSEWAWSQGVGDEVLVDLKFDVDLNFDRSLLVRLEGSFWESDDEERTDLEMSQTWSWTILPEQTQVHRLYLWNKEEDTPGDNFDITLTLTNQRQP